MTSTHDSLPSNEDNEPNKWSEPFLALQEQLTSRCSWVSPKPSVKQKKEEPKDAAALLNELVDRIDQGNITDLDSGILRAEVDLFINVLCTELKSIGSANKIYFRDTLNYWSQFKCQALFNNHPVTAHIIYCLLKKYHVYVDKQDMRVAGHAFLLLQCQDEHTPLDSILRIYDLVHRGDIKFEEFIAWYPVYGALLALPIPRSERHKIINTVIDAPKIIEKQLESVRCTCISISFVKSDMTGAPVKQYTVTSSMLLKWVCRAYARDSKVPLKSIRFTYEGRILFLSEGKKTVGEQGMKHLSVINVTVLTQSVTDTIKDQEAVSNKPNKSKPSKTKKKKGKKKNGNNKKKPASNNCYSLMSEQEKHRQLHSKALSKVFEEAERTRFFSIRQRLNAMNLECMKPKSRKAIIKPLPPSSQSIDNPPSFGEGGKAGKSHVFVQVGEESNLYKTSKPLSNRSNQRSSSRASATNKAIVIDLHGLTKAEALAKLDKALPVWIDKAMTGGYPFVRTVKIVHGGGNQVLEEVVASWIRQNKQVANAPKSMYM